MTRHYNDLSKEEYEEIVDPIVKAISKTLREAAVPHCESLGFDTSSSRALISRALLKVTLTNFVVATGAHERDMKVCDGLYALELDILTLVENYLGKF